MKERDEQIKVILEDFDFKKVHSTMTFLNWEWKFENGRRVPSYQELEHNAKMQLRKAWESKENYECVSLGGFEAVKMDGVLELRFVLEISNPLSKLFNPKA